MDYQRYFEIAIAIFNENVGSDFTVDNVVLDYLTSDNQKQVFERFCTEYFPYRLKDRYEEEGYFDFYATALSQRNREERMVSFSVPIFHIHPQN